MNIKLTSYIKAAYPFLWLNTDEYADAFSDTAGEILRVCDKSVYRWTVDGLEKFELAGTTLTPRKMLDPTMDVLAPIIWLKKEMEANRVTHSVLYLYDWHLSITIPIVWRTMLSLLDELTAAGCSLIFLSPVVTLPKEIESYVTIVPYALPDYNELLGIAKSVVSDNSAKGGNSTQNLEELAKYGLGMGRFEFVNAIYLCVVCGVSEKGVLNPSVIQHQKENKLMQDSVLKVLKSECTFADVCGLDNLKSFTKDMITSKLGKGVLILGVPGSGKTMFASTLGNETGRPVISLDFSNLMGSLVGETERKTEKALKTVDAMSPCILFIDELEKGLAGTSGGSGDSGTSKRQGSLFLKWLSDHKTDVYVVATANSLTDLPTEYLRAERWDAVFFVGLPDDTQRKALINMYAKKYGITSGLDVDMTNWTGAEVKSICRIAKARGFSLADARQYIVPVALSQGSKVQELIESASKFAVNATTMLDEGAVLGNSTGRALKV